MRIGYIWDHASKPRPSDDRGEPKTFDTGGESRASDPGSDPGVWERGLKGTVGGNLVNLDDDPVVSALEGDGHAVDIIDVDVLAGGLTSGFKQIDLAFDRTLAFGDPGRPFEAASLLEAARLPYVGSPPLAVAISRRPELAQLVVRSMRGPSAPALPRVMMDDAIRSSTLEVQVAVLLDPEPRIFGTLVLRDGMPYQMSDPSSLRPLEQDAVAAASALGFRDYGQIDFTLDSLGCRFVRGHPQPVLIGQSAFGVATDQQGLDLSEVLDKILRTARRRS